MDWNDQGQRLGWIVGFFALLGCFLFFLYIVYKSYMRNIKPNLKPKENKDKMLKLQNVDYNFLIT